MRAGDRAQLVKFVVYHSSYGCETGCCGHVVEPEDGPGYRFQFIHPDRGEDHRAFAESLLREEFGEEHVADLDWDNCLICED